jgi:peroxiredoxin
MKKILFTMLFLTTGLYFGFSQDSGNAKQDTTHVKVQSDAGTTYLDENGQKIDQEKFMALVASDQYVFKPKMENGKMVALQLKKNDKKLQAGAEAPGFTVSDIKGNSYRLSDLKGKIIVLNFWFTSCVPCINEMPELNKLNEKYKDNPGIVFIAITYDPDERVKDFLAKRVFNYPVVTGQKALIERYGISSYPTNIIVDKSGHVAFSLTAYSPDNVKKLDAAIADQAKL